MRRLLAGILLLGILGAACSGDDDIGQRTDWPAAPPPPEDVAAVCGAVLAAYQGGLSSNLSTELRDLGFLLQLAAPEAGRTIVAVSEAVAADGIDQIGGLSEVAGTLEEMSNGGCSGALEAVASVTTDADVIAGLLDARARWTAAGAVVYTMQVEVGCFCPDDYRGPFEVVVENGEVVSATYRGGPVSDQAPSEYFTADGLFSTIEFFAAADRIDVNYDPDTGIPTLIDVDPSLSTIDEELTLTVTDLSVEY